MKTPREILFHRHEAADAKLDALRRNVVAQLHPAATPDRQPLLIPIALILWRELILPARRLWTGLATAWVVIVTLHLTTGETSKTISLTTPAAPVTPETIQALKQQRLLYTELVGLPESSPLNRTKINIPGPHSQRREETAVV